MSLLNHFRTYPQLSLCSALLLLLGLFGAVFYLHNSEKNQQAAVEHYGQVLANSSARQAVEATLNQDMVSLQAILQEVAQYPNVVGATLRNIDNKLMVQSGYRPDQLVKGKRYNFSAPVALHNNVAGYLEVTLESSGRTREDELFLMSWAALVTGCLLTIWWSIHRRWWQSLRDKMPTASDLVTAVVDKIPTIAEATPDVVPEKATPLKPTLISVRLNLHLLNLSKLHQQLNNESFTVILRRFEKQLHALLQLYNGQRQLLNNDILAIDFVGEEFYECSFRATCCAQILFNMTAQSPSPRLHLAAVVQPHLTAISDNSFAQEFALQRDTPSAPNKNEIVLSEKLLDVKLLNHVEFDVGTGKLVAIKAPYRDYVKKQEEQLLLRHR